MTIPNTINYMQEYFDRSGIHGVQYFLEKNRTKCEKIFWIVVFIVSITLCFFVIFETYQTWNENAVGLVISNKKMLIYDIPFPAITICPVSKIPKCNCSHGLKYAYYLCESLDDEYDSEEHYDNYMKKKCNYTTYNHKYFNESRELLQFMDDVKPKVFIQKCRFQKKSCLRRDFTPIITRKGICYTFNLLNEENIFRNSVWHYPLELDSLIVNPFSYDSTFIDVKFRGDTGVNEFVNFYNDVDPHPKRQFYQGQQYGLQLHIVTPQTEIDNCSSSQLGYDVFVHDSLSLPGYNGFKLLLNESRSVRVNPRLVNVSENIKKYSIEKRKCYFQNERALQYFKIYTKSNCEMECWTNYSLAYCGCMHFSMPTSNRTRICAGTWWNVCATVLARELTTGDMIMEEIKNGYSSIGTESFLDNRKSFGNQTYLKSPNCKCLPSCSNVEYNTEITQSKLEDDFLSKYFEEKDKNAHLSTLYVFFGENEVTAYVRKQLYGPVDFLASFGGLLGLFCGFSILSLVEMLYFMTVRIICNKITYGQWSGQK